MTVKEVYHFVGIAREELREAGWNQTELPESFRYQTDTGHINVYKMGSGLTKDIRGEWKLALKLQPNTGTVQSFAVNAAASALNVVKEDHDVWRFERKEGADQIRIFLVEESKWLDEWKGHIYNDGWTEAQMMEFLSQNCMVQAEVRWNKISA